MELGSVSLLGDISLVGCYSLPRASKLSNMLREQMFAFINQPLMQSTDRYLKLSKKVLCKSW